MSYVIAGRVVKNEYIALATLFTAFSGGYLASRGGSSSKKAEPEKPKNIVDSVKDTFKSSDEEAFIRDWIAKAEKEEAKH